MGAPKVDSAGLGPGQSVALATESQRVELNPSKAIPKEGVDTKSKNTKNDSQRKGPALQDQAYNHAGRAWAQGNQDWAKFRGDRGGYRTPIQTPTVRTPAPSDETVRKDTRQEIELAFDSARELEEWGEGTAVRRGGERKKKPKPEQDHDPRRSLVNRRRRYRVLG